MNMLDELNKYLMIELAIDERKPFTPAYTSQIAGDK